MIRLFLSHEHLASKEIIITGGHARHLALVLRARPGEPIVVFDGRGYKYDCRIVRIHKREVVAELMKKTPCSLESPVTITLAQGVPKGDKMDFIIQKSTELGIHKVIPVITERSQVRHTDKIRRWRKIALSASEQSGRDKIPEIDEPVDFQEFLSGHSIPLEKEARHGFSGIIFSEGHKENNLRKFLSSLGDTREITLLIGPEGGFSGEETANAVQKGFMEVSLGPRILRTETAPVAAISIIQYELGDMG